jgi:hypothetical protein
VHETLGPLNHHRLDLIRKKNFLELCLPVRTGKYVQVEIKGFIQGFQQVPFPFLIDQGVGRLTDAKRAYEIHGGVDVVSLQANFYMNLADFLEP